MTAIRIIKKYPNRRLYDTELGAYITLDDVKQLVFDRVDFKIVDARTDKDLTQGTLLQIISEQEAGSTPIFTTPLLLELIRSYHEKSQNLFTQYLEQTMHLFKEQKNFLQNQWLVYQKLLANPNPALLREFLNRHQMTSPVPKKTQHKKKRKDNSK